MDHSKLIHRMLTAEVSAEEKKMIESLGSDPSFNEQYETYKAIWQSSKEYFPNKDWDKEGAKTAFLNKIRNTSPSAAPKSNVKPWIMALIAVIALGLLYLTISNLVGEDRIITTDAGEFALLEDKTELWMGANSSATLDYTSTNMRKVKLQGEAVFHVAKDPKRPFTVTFGDMNVEVLGTTFKIIENIDGISKVEVRSGRVKLYSALNAKNHTIVSAGEQAVIDHRAKNVKIIPSASVTAFQGIVVKTYRNALLTEVLKDAKKAYGVNLFYNEVEVKDCRVSSLNMGDISLDELFDILKVTYPTIRITKAQENTYRLDGLVCN